MAAYTVAALYKFVSLPDYEALQQPLQAVCDAAGVFGTLLLASEGINGTIAGQQAGIDAVLKFLDDDGRFDGKSCKFSYTDEMPFLRMKVRLKKEIVTMGVEGIDPNQQCGERVGAERWNELISDPETLVIDTRNQYEVDIGTFENAVSPETETFREFPDYVQQNLDPNQHKRVAMFCTGGIRCEKSTSYMLQAGFDEVYHLDGGILKYLETVRDNPELTDNKWQGECFVFDERVAVDAELNPGSYKQCHACRRPLSEADMASPDYELGISCPHCIAGLSADRESSLRERQKQVELAKARGEKHIGAAMKAGQKKFAQGDA